MWRLIKGLARDETRCQDEDIVPFLARRICHEWLRANIWFVTGETLSLFCIFTYAV